MMAHRNESMVTAAQLQAVCANLAMQSSRWRRTVAAAASTSGLATAANPPFVRQACFEAQLPRNSSTALHALRFCERAIVLPCTVRVCLWLGSMIIVHLSI
jgi:hypothetical protein